MKPSIKIIIFLVIAFVIVFIIALSRGSGEPVQNTNTSVTPTPTASSTGAIPATSSTYTLADVAKHATAADCWTSIKGGVYNLTSFVNKHPGGVAAISQLCGKEGTATFTAMHGGQPNPEKVLASLQIGTLKQ